MRQYLIIGNGEVKDNLTLKKRIVTNHIHSVYDTEEEALRLAHWINQLQTGLNYHVEEKVYAFPTADIADGWTVGTLVIEDQQAYLQLEDDSIIPATGIIEIKNGDFWERPDYPFWLATTKEGWPAYAGMRARIRPQQN